MNLLLSILSLFKDLFTKKFTGNTINIYLVSCREKFTSFVSVYWVQYGEYVIQLSSLHFPQSEYNSKTAKQYKQAYITY